MGQSRLKLLILILTSMTNNKKLTLLIASLLISLATYFIFETEEEDLVDTSLPAIPSTLAPVTDHQISGRKIIGLPPEKEEAVLKDLKVANVVSEDWSERLKESIQLQGGDEIEEIVLSKVASLIWVQNDVGINVESVQVRIKNKEGDETLFRALVDSQTGKILETWDRPIMDPVNPRKGFRLTVDPRYFNQ